MTGVGGVDGDGRAQVRDHRHRGGRGDRRDIRDAAIRGIHHADDDAGISDDDIGGAPSAPPTTELDWRATS